MNGLGCVGCLALVAWAMSPAGSSRPAEPVTGHPPVLAAFVLPRQSADLTFPVMELKASGAVVGYRITKTPISPAAAEPGWSPAPPKSITEPEPGVYDYYVWVADARGQVSRFAAQTVDVATTRITVGGKGRDFADFAGALAAVAAKGHPKGVVIEADAGEYPSWRKDGGFPADNLANILRVAADNLTIRGVGGRAHLAYKCRGAAGKDRWTIPPATQHGAVIVQAARNLRLEHVEVSGGCNANSMNGAGLWVEPTGVGTVLKDCFFHDNDNGVLTSKSPEARVVILHSEFAENGAPGPADEGQNHNLYIGQIGELVFMFNYSHASFRGQLLKSRAARNYILYNRLTDERDSNYPIDLPYGGESYVIGNPVQMSPSNRSATFINYGREVVLEIVYRNGGPEPLTDRAWLTNTRTGWKSQVHYSLNYGARGTWANRDRANYCTLRVTQSDQPDFRAGDRLTYSQNSGIDVVSAEWSWSGPKREIYVCSNTFVNQCHSGYGQYLLRAHPDTSAARLQNNLIVDLKPPRHPYKLHPDASKSIREKPVTEAGNLWCTSDPGLTDLAQYDYSLRPSAVAAIDKATPAGSVNGLSLAPVYQYVHPCSCAVRPADGELDLGAYESRRTAATPRRNADAATPGTGVAAPRETLAAVSPATQSAFRMNPKLADLPDNTWLKMDPTFVYHPDQLAALEQAGRKPHHFCHVKGEGSLCYDAAANLTLYFGGCTSGYGNNHWVYDCSANVWTQIHPDVFTLNENGLRYREDPKAIPPGCCCYGICYDANRRVSVLVRSNGGATAWVPPEQPPNNLIWLYDAPTRTWQFTPQNGPIRPTLYLTGARIAYDPERKESLLVDGRTLWAYRTADNLWRRIDVEGPAPKTGGLNSWVYLDRERKFLLFRSPAAGDKTDTGSTTWLYDPMRVAWENVTAKDGPCLRAGAAMAYDSLNHVAVMIGGWNEAPSRKLNDGAWVFDATTRSWTCLRPDPAPPIAGNVYQLAYDQVNNVFIYVTTEKGDAGYTWVYRYRKTRR
jgi:hypothetical protein